MPTPKFRTFTVAGKAVTLQPSPGMVLEAAVGDVVELLPVGARASQWSLGELPFSRAGRALSGFSLRAKRPGVFVFELQSTRGRVLLVVVHVTGRC